MFGRALARAEASFANLGRQGWSVQPSALGRDAFLEYTDSTQTAAGTCASETPAEQHVRASRLWHDRYPRGEESHGGPGGL
jgi:hypothetical protein